MFPKNCANSSFCGGVDENCTALGYHTRRVAKIPYRCCGTTYRSILQGVGKLYVTDRFSRNVSQELPILAAKPIGEAICFWKPISGWKVDGGLTSNVAGTRKDRVWGSRRKYGDVLGGWSMAKATGGYQHSSSSWKISKSMMQIGNATALPSVYKAHLTCLRRWWRSSRKSLVLIQRVSKHQSVTKLTTIQPLAFTYTYKTTYTY